MHGSHGSFDPVEFLDYLRSRGLFCAICCALAVTTTLVVSLLLPTRYSATSTILIQTPVGNDPRAATALSQVYLDSLKTYESFAGSDTLFLAALDRLQLRGGNANIPIESLKRSVLKVSRLPSTSILEIRVTWADPRKAQAFAQYIAEQTVALGKSIEARTSEDVLKEIHARTDAAQAAWARARRERDDYAASNPVAALENEIAESNRFQALLERDLELAKADAAELSAQQSFGDTEQLRKQAAAARARVAVFEDQRRELDARLGKITSQLERSRIRRAMLDREEDAAHASYDKLEAGLNDALSSSPWRGSHLEIVDPGIVPQQPSYPNTRLNVMAAFFASLAASFGYVVCRFSWKQLVRAGAERAYSFR